MTARIAGPIALVLLAVGLSPGAAAYAPGGRDLRVAAPVARESGVAHSLRPLVAGARIGTGAEPGCLECGLASLALRVRQGVAAHLVDLAMTIAAAIEEALAALGLDSSYFRERPRPIA